MGSYDIWIEGYICTGARAGARFLAAHEGTDFEDACIRFSKTPAAEGLGDFNEQDLSFWGRGLYKTQEEAVKNFN